MAGIEVDPVQRAGARALLDQAVSLADTSDSWKAQCYRRRLITPSESLRMVCGQAGFSPFPAAWFAYLGERLARSPLVVAISQRNVT